MRHRRRASDRASKQRASPKALLVRRLEQERNRLSGKQAVLAAVLLREYRKAAFMTPGGLAARLKISSSTIIRVAVSLEHDGDLGLRRHLYQIVQADPARRFEEVAKRPRVFHAGD